MRKLLSIGVLLSVITGLLVMMLVSTFTISAHSAYLRQKEASQLLSMIQITQTITLSKEAARIDQGVIYAALQATKGASTTTLDQITRLHTRSERALSALLNELQAPSSNEVTPGLAMIVKRYALNRKLFSEVIANLKKPISQRRADLINDWSDACVNLLDAIDDQSDILSSRFESPDSFIDDMMRVNQIAWSVRSFAGADRRLVATAIASGGKMSLKQRLQIARIDGITIELWDTLRRTDRVTDYPPLLEAAIGRATSVYFGEFRTLRQQLLDRLMTGSAVQMSGEEWLRLSNPGLNSIAAISKIALDLTKSYATDQVVVAKRHFYIAIGLMLLSIGLACFTAIYVMWRVIRPLKAITRAMSAGADSNLVCAIPLKTREDEIGQFARALLLFREGALERQRLERDLMHNQVARESAETSNRIKSEFLANMSHELRTPLNAILGFSDVMMHRLFGPLSDRYGEYASLIHESGTHLLNLVSDILDLAKIEAGKFVLDLRPVNLEEIVAYCVQCVAQRAADRGIVLTTDLRAAPVTLIADPRACKQILLNLLSNGVKFARTGGNVNVTAMMAGGNVRIVVRDDGMGIPPAALSRIGQAFEQASNDPMLAREGTGLGLALVRALVGQHAGLLQIVSEEGVGTSVTVELPLIQQGRLAA